MSRVDHPLYLVGGTRNAAVFNTVQTDVVAASAALDEWNYRHQGMTRDRFARQPMWDLQEVISEPTRADPGLGSTLGVFAGPLAWGGTTFQLAPFSLATGDRLLVRYRVHFSSYVTAPAGLGIPSGATGVSLRLSYDVGGGGVAVAASERQVVPSSGGRHGVLAGMALFTGPLSFNYIQIDRKNSVICYPHTGVLEGILLKRVT